MAQSGGRLVMKSSPETGTTAELWLPLAHEAAAPAPSVEADSAEPLRPLSVLAVDDDSLVLLNTVLILEDLGHSVRSAHSAVEALQILQDGPVPDVLITDHAMPQMTGAELAAVVEERYPTVSIVLATGYAELPAGAGSHLLRLPKPFTEAQLSQALRSADQNRVAGER